MLLSLSAQAQHLPDSILDKVIKELIYKDHLSYVVNKQDSTLKVYAQSDSLQRMQISNYKLVVHNDEVIAAKLQQTIQIQGDELNSLKKQLRKEKWRRVIGFFEGGAIGAGIVLILSIFK